MQLPWWEKYTLSMEEAAEYFGIGYKKLRKFVDEHKEADFVLSNGTRTHIKRKLFEKYVDEYLDVI